MASKVSQTDLLQVISVDPQKSRTRTAYPKDQVQLTLRHSPSSISTRSSASQWSVNSRTSQRSATSYTSSPRSEYSFDTVPTLTKTPWELSRSRRTFSQTSGTSRSSDHLEPLPAHIFENLPDDVYKRIIQQIETAHMTKSEDFCSSCYLKDLCTLCSTSKKWYAATKEAMYQKIWVPLNDQPLQPRKLKLKSATQLKRLCRTLHKRPHLAVLVKELKISAQDRASLTVPTKDKESAFELLASLVAACPNLQRLTGFCPSYGHIADSLVIELHRATKLKEHTWIIGPKKLTPAQTIIQGSAPRGLPSPAQTTAFVSRHSGWSSLQTLVLGSDNGNLGTGAIYGTLRRLPSLKHLCISNFDARDFHDDTMHALPYLHSLRLENLPGLTDRGLSTLADRRVCRSLRRLTLLNLEFVSAPLAARILAAAPHLVKFALAQDRIPDLPFGAAFSAPFFASASLRFLHWDVPHPGPALDLLADSFRAGGLPALRRLRAPIDPSGVLQQLCQPRADIARSGDVALAAADLAAQNDGPEKRPQGALNIRKLSVARLAAQKRIEEARRVPAVRVVVEEEGVLRGSHTLRGYMGTLRSKVEYWLEPDVEGDDKAVGDVGELLRGSTMMGEEVCLGGVTGKKGGHGSRRMEKLVGSEILF